MKIIRPSCSSYGPFGHNGMLVYYYSSNGLVRYYFWNRLSSLLDFAKFRPGDTVLEVGFGPGIAFPSLAYVCNRIIGIDPLFDSITHFPSTDLRIVENMCKSEGIHEKVELIRGDGQNIPIQQEICDIVIATDVLEHIQDLSRFMKEIERVLKIDGSFLACIPMENLYRRNARRLLSLPGLSADEHFYKEILESMKSVFQITKMKLYPRVLPISILVGARRKN